jgi:ABC-type amino acid transport substrate-binding protein
MCSRFRDGIWAIALTLLVCGCAGSDQRRPVAAQANVEAPAPRRVLRIAADPNNLPFSNENLEGFENKIAKVIAADLDADVEYVWRAQRRGFFRHAFKEDGCELVLGVPAHFDMAATTSPYYRSTYVFVSRADRGLKIASFDDPKLREL